MNDLQTVNALASAIDSMIDKISGVEETAVNYLGKIDNLQEYAQEQAQEKVDEMCERITTEVNAKLEEQRTVLVGMISKTADAVTENMKAVEPIVNFNLNSISTVGDVVSFLTQVQEAFAGPYRKAEILITAISTDILPKLMELATIINNLSNLKNLIPTLKCKDGKTVNVDKLNVHMDPITESDVGVYPTWKSATYNLGSGYGGTWMGITPSASNKFYAICSPRYLAKGSPNDGWNISQSLPADVDNYWQSILEDTKSGVLFVLGDKGKLLTRPNEYSNWDSSHIASYYSTDGDWITMSICEYSPFGPYFFSSRGSITYGGNIRRYLNRDKQWKGIYCDNLLDSNDYYYIYTISSDGFVGILKNKKDDLYIGNLSLVSQVQRLNGSKYWVDITKVKSSISSQSSYFMALASDGTYATSTDGETWIEQENKIPNSNMPFGKNNIAQDINTNQIIVLNNENGKIYTT